MAVEFDTNLERGLEDQKFRGKFPSYLREVDRQLRNGFSGGNSRWGIADTYDHTRGFPQSGRDNDRRRRNDPYRTFPRHNPPNRRRSNCDVCGEVGYGVDNGDYFDGEWRKSDYQGGRPQSQVNFTENDNNYSSRGVEFGDIGGRNTDSEAVCYLPNKSAAKEYRGAGRSVDCAVFKTFAKTNLLGLEMSRRK